MRIRPTVLPRADRSWACCAAALLMLLGVGTASESRAADPSSAIAVPASTLSGTPGIATRALTSGHSPSVSSSTAASPVPPSPLPPRRVDIPAQPLADALQQYGAMSGRPVFFDSSLVADRTSAPVSGVLTPEAALRMLLEGTGLVAEHVPGRNADAFVLKAANVAAQAKPAASTGSHTVYRGYDGLIQQRILQAFCRNPRTEPGGYRTAIRFGVDRTGHIVDAAVLHSTGDADRDAAIVATLDQVRIEAAPPSDMEQPITIVILPRTEAPGQQCRLVQ